MDFIFDYAAQDEKYFTVADLGSQIWNFKKTDWRDHDRVSFLYPAQQTGLSFASRCDNLLWQESAINNGLKLNR